MPEDAAADSFDFEAVFHRHDQRVARVIAAVWSGADRVYALYPDTREVTREFVMTVANALD